MKSTTKIMDVERYMLTSSNHGVETKIELCKREKQIVWVTL